MGECLEVCMKANGCSILHDSKDTHTVCKLNNFDSYHKLVRFFE